MKSCAQTQIYLVSFFFLHLYFKFYFGANRIPSYKLGYFNPLEDYNAVKFSNESVRVQHLFFPKDLLSHICLSIHSLGEKNVIPSNEPHSFLRHNLSWVHLTSMIVYQLIKVNGCQLPRTHRREFKINFVLPTQKKKKMLTC